MRLISKLLVVVCALLILSYGAVRSDELAAVLQITQAGVQLKLANTNQWLPLPASAETPISKGDKVRTDGFGRAFIYFPDAVDVFLLPNSTLKIVTFEQLEDGVQLSMRLDGHIIQQNAPDTMFDSFALETTTLTVTQPAEHFSVWAQADDLSVVTVAEGNAEVVADETRWQLAQGEGIRTSTSADPVVLALAPPLSPARLIGFADGCLGRTQSANNLNINVRTAPGLDSVVIGNLPDDQPVQVVGINHFKTWYRVQVFNGFGWMQTLLVETDCLDIPVMSAGTSERNMGIWSVTLEELEFLEPFYGPHQDDVWFYRSVLSAPPG